MNLLEKIKEKIMKKIKPEETNITTKVTEPTISNNQAMLNIVQWLYTNDGRYSTKHEWREEFLNMLSWNIKRIKNENIR